MLSQLSQINIVRWYHTSSKRTFMLDHDIYENWVILAADEGQFNYRLHDVEGSAQYGDFILCPPHTPLFRRNNEPLSFLFIEFHWGQLSPELEQQLATLPDGKISIHRIERYNSLFSLIRQFSSPDIAHHMLHQQHLLQDLLYLYIVEQLYPVTKHAVLDQDAAIQQAIDYIQNHAFEPINLQLIAEHVALSSSQFTRRFQTSTGISPIVYLTKIRMDKAHRLLMNTPLSLEEIAEQCGYQNGFYLSRVFKKIYGVSPAHYRKTYQI